MGMEKFTLTTDLQPSITVKNRSKENYEDALAKAKSALYEKMHNMVDYYCEQISLLERSALQLNHADMNPLAFWNELTRYTTVRFEEKTPLFHKYQGANDFDCYCVLLDYDKMQLPWPDGYKDPARRINGLAPLGLNDNYFFYAEGNILYRLDFGTCAHKEMRLDDGAAFNQRMESVAKTNYEIGKYVTGVSYVREAFEKLIKAKHGDGPTDSLSVMEILDSFTGLLRSRPELQEYSLHILPTVDETTSNFPQQFGLFKNGKPVYLEAFFDSVFF
ncbi:MAG: hypothetical protein J1E01_11260 [Acetatifactor sp.]|nr:hypothetical protein [Acetatifactor sp.]